MNIFIVYAHPSRESYTYKVLETLTEGLKKAGHSVEISDLYEMNFKSDMTEEEYQREGLVNLSIPIANDVAMEHAKIDNSDCIIFIYPIWWSDCPAKLKGWFDRVYSVGYAYGFGKSETKLTQMKKIKYGLIICTAGHPNSLLQEIGIADSMRNVMIDDRLGARFDKKKMIILGGTVTNEDIKETHIQTIAAISENLEKVFEEN